MSRNIATIQGEHKKRRGVHSKTKNSKLKSNKYYVKPYKGQGK